MLSLALAKIYTNYLINQMSKKKKISALEILMVVACAIGLLLFLGERFIDTGLNLSSIGLIFNGVGIFTLLYLISKKKQTGKDENQT